MPFFYSILIPDILQELTAERGPYSATDAAIDFHHSLKEVCF